MTFCEFNGRIRVLCGCLADVMELADMQDLGSCVARRAGSNPAIRIICDKLNLDKILYYLYAFIPFYSTGI